MTSDPSLREIGRAISQLHLKVSRIAETLEDRPSGEAAWAGDSAGDLAGAEAGLDGWLGLIDAVDAAVKRRGQPGAVKKRFWRRGEAGSTVENEVWRGLQLAAAEAHERVGRMGIELAPETGEFDPRWHRAIETAVPSDPSFTGTIAKTHQRGWMRRATKVGGAPVVLRTALVTVYQG